ncbi:GNAT family N-acetyltransferase [Arthrobacter echini]|uniref:GNAT family N-acetyltransferase n=2 Tax=Arthrobacter echini TaxID=1529066 RepID=A0A4S5E2Y3_9MICC|nr:GNAT family N-acetyltransferase [Arthrobacter echini]
MAIDEAHVRLVAVDEDVLERLVQAATTGAAADDVTPPLTRGDAWTPMRIAWLKDFHRSRRAGLGGPAAEATWAVLFEQRVVGSVRLLRADRSRQVEAGVWLIGEVRGRGVGQAATAAVLREAAARGATPVMAHTTANNAGALAVLERLGFELRAGDARGAVDALLFLDRDLGLHPE